MDHSQQSVPDVTDLQQLLSLFNLGDLITAEQYARELIAGFPLHGFAWKVLGVILKQQGQIIDSILPMKKAVELLPDDAEAHSNLGVNLMNQGQLAEAVLSYRRALELNPDYMDVHHNLGLTLMNLTQWQEQPTAFGRSWHLIMIIPMHISIWDVCFRNWGNCPKQSNVIVIFYKPIPN